MKSITIAGRTGKAAEMRRTQDGTPVMSFSVAVDNGWGERKSTLWFDCSLFGTRGDALHKHLPKGTPVTVSGDFSTREHDGKTYLQVRVNDVTLQGGKGEPRQPAEPDDAPVEDDEIPF
jgi:single-strand DNA-binding protein